MKYKCTKCNLAVAITPDGATIKACRCDAPISAEMSANAVIKANVNA